MTWSTWALLLALMCWLVTLVMYIEMRRQRNAFQRLWSESRSEDMFGRDKL